MSGYACSMNKMKNIIMVRNLKSEENAKKIREAFLETRVEYRIDLEKQCVIVEGNSDLVAVARKIITDNGFILL